MTVSKMVVSGASAALCIIVTALGYCAGPAHASHAPPARVDRAKEFPPHKHPLELIGKVNGRRWYLPWYIRNLRDLNGPPIPVLIANAESGEVTRHGENPEIVMHRVSARLFQKGVPAANVRAGKVRANQQTNRVFASGGCTIVSLINPADTVLTADRITWDTRNTLFIAEGHAHVARKPHNGGPAMTQDGGKIVYDLEHNTVTVL